MPPLKQKSVAATNGASLETLLKRIENKEAVVGVFGLGYVGLPFAVTQAQQGYQTIGIEPDFRRFKLASHGESYIADIPSEDLSRLIDSKKLEVVRTADKAVGRCDVLLITVPTPLSKQLSPDLRAVKAVGKSIAEHLKPHTLVCLESTTYPGTTSQKLRPLLEQSGLKVEEDFYLAYSPERVDPGNKKFDTVSTPRVVGGIGPKSLKAATAFYSKSIQNIMPVSSCNAAEMSKIFENTFRSVNIALVNEFTLLCDKLELNVWEVLEAAHTKPFGIMPFFPGPGVGGHCIPLDPHYLEWKAREVQFATQFISLAGEVNRSMPVYVCDKISRLLNKRGIALSRSKVLFLGVGYKNNSSDIRESPALTIVASLIKSGANVNYHDPLVPSVISKEIELKSVELNESALKETDLVVITNGVKDIDYSWILKNAPQVFDTRNATKHIEENRQKIVLL